MRPPDFTLPNYLHRWHMLTRPKRRWNVYLHHILAPDPGEHLHDHPANSISIVLRGTYTERLQDGTLRHNRPGTIRFRRAEEAHRIIGVAPAGCWTIWIRGGHRRKWGFWVDGTWVPWDEHENLERST